jgi:anaerobic magnesium-protoporphyrin IX monomethyl ester cyclase
MAAMKLALVHPPTCDPTAPYVALPLLAACLRAAGHEVLLVDANLEAWDRLLRPGPLGELGARVEGRLRTLEARPALGHGEQLEHAVLWAAREDARSAPAGIARSLATLRGARFYDPEHYDAAVRTVESALRLVGAAHHPLELSFAGYRTPFSLLSLAAVEDDAREERNPFFGYFEELAARVVSARVDLVGLSIVFPGQVQPAYALAGALRRARPELPVVAGGPALTQLLLGLEGAARERALGPFHAAVLFEGEEALAELAGGLARGERPRGVMAGTQGRALADLPAPDYDGLPIDRYLSPEPVLSYDLSRGCYWGRCAFCHYGLTARGTACYRERPAARAAAQLGELARRHGCRLFYLSQDSVAPRTMLALARALRASGESLRWSTDLRPERFFDAQRSAELAAGGALSVSLGVESAAPRVLELIDKGISVEDMRRAVLALSGAGIAAELMCISDFPGETRDEALATLGFLEQHRESIALFIWGEFALTRGSRVAAEPGVFGLREIWRVAGDELGTGLFFEERRPSKDDEDRIALEEALAGVERGWLLRRYPWAGALSTAHSMLWYDRYGPGVFRELDGQRRRPARRGRGGRSRFDPERIARQSAAREAEIWSTLIYEDRRVSPDAYREFADALPAVRPRRRRT